MTQHFDYLVIGGGSGGIASANRAARLGKKAAIIEAKYIGGTCVNVGCVPKKAMWYAGQIADALKYAHDYGFGQCFSEDEKHFDWSKLVTNREAYIERIHAAYQRGFDANKVSVINGFARFIDKNTVDVNGEQITADHITIATGGRPSIPTIEGAEYGIDSDGFFALKAQPESVAVVGAGYIAVELAGVFHALGTKSHLLVRKEKPLRGFDNMLSDTLVEQMAKHGPTLHNHSLPKRIEKLADMKGLRVFGVPTAGRFLARYGLIPVIVPWDDVEVAMQTGELDGVCWCGFTEAYEVGWADICNYALSNAVTGAWFGSYFANTKSWDKLPPKLQELYRISIDQSHYYRQVWYWGGEADLRVNGKKMEITGLPADEWSGVVDDSKEFWAETAQISPRCAKVVDAFNKYADTMEKAGYPYR